MDSFWGFILVAAGVIAAILNTILYFKIWRMTDNVELLKACALAKNKAESEENRLVKAKAEWIRGNREAAKQILDDMFYKKLADIFDLYDFQKAYNQLVDQYSRMYKRMGLPEPDYDAFNRQ